MTDDACNPGLTLPEKAGRWRAWNLVWLIYSVFFFIQPLQSGSRRDWLIFAAVYPVFLAIYVTLIWARQRRTRLIMLLAMAILGAAYYPLNPSAGATMFIYVASLMPFTARYLSLAVGTIIAATIASAGEGILLHQNAWSWGSLSFLAATIGTGNLIQALRRGATERLLRAQEEIEQLAKLAERERIARDLHDVLGHTLSVVVLKSELAGKLMSSDTERARVEIGEVEQIARKALAEVREAIRGYRAEGLFAEIARARRTLDVAGVSLDCQTEGVRLEPAQESVLSLVLREAVTNILRHAGATSCRLEVAADDRGTVLRVEDNGRGAIEREGNGIRGMRERVEALGGRLRIESSQGTRLTAEIPHAAAARA